MSLGIPVTRFLTIHDMSKVLSYSVRRIHNIPNNKNYYDIIVAGGGMVGTSMACSLGMNSKLANRRILLLEESPEKTWELKPEYSNRVSALSGHSKKFLDSIGTWTHIKNTRFKAVKKMQIWEANSDAVITFNDENLEQDIAYIVENDVCMSAINKQLKKTTGPVEVLYRAKIKSYQLPSKSDYSQNGLVKLQLEDGATYACNLLIGADGANSKVRKTMGVQYLSWSYKQMGVVATVKLSEPTNNIVAWQRFLPTGPVALLPLTNELSSLVWSTSTEEAKLLLDLNSESFVDCLNEALWRNYPRHEIVETLTKKISDFLFNVFGPTIASGARQLQPSIISIVEGSKAAFPLGFGHSARYVAPGVALVGDAAHRVHPLAGMGVNLGFGDVDCLQQKLAEAAYAGAELGNLHYLLEYESERQKHNLPRMMVIDTLQKLYGTGSLPIVLLRSVGLQLTDAMNPFKPMSLSKKSPIWEFFTSCEDGLKAKCQICSLKISRGGKTPKSFATTSMINHLRSRHNKKYKEYEEKKKELEKNEASKIHCALTNQTLKQQSLQECFNKAIPYSSESVEAKKLNRMLAEMLAIDCQPFSIVEDEGFLRFAQAMNPRYQVPSRRHVTEKIVPDVHSAVLKKVNEKIKCATCVSCTTDIWTCRNNQKSFLSLTAQWIDNEFNHASALLACREISGSHTANNIVNLIEEILK